MYTKTDLELITNPYFKLLSYHPTYCELQSVCTGHYWLIQKEANHYVLFHKHHASDPYHRQLSAGCPPTIKDLLLDIADHDLFVRNKRRPLLFRPKETFYEYILNAYS